MVTPILAWTAAHCVVSLRLGHVVPPSAVHILTGYDQGTFVRHAVAISVRIAPGFDLNRPDATRGADFALVTLGSPVVAAGLPLADAARGAPVMLGGYSQDRAEQLSADLHCRVTGSGVDPQARPLLLHDCAGTRGTSGGPILVRSGDAWAVAGIQVAGFDGGSGGVAVPASALHSLIDQSGR